MNRWAFLAATWFLPWFGIDTDRILDYVSDPGKYHDEGEAT